MLQYELSPPSPLPTPMPPHPRPKYSSTHLLTDVHHIDIHRVGEGAAQSVGGHHGDVVVDPDGRVILVKEAGVLSSRLVVGTLMHRVRAAGEARSRIFEHKEMVIATRTGGCASELQAHMKEKSSDPFTATN